MTGAPCRLPLRLDRPPAGGTVSLDWQVPHGALVLPGETVCTVRGGQGETAPLKSPLPGRLHLLAPSVRRLSPETILGELEYGAEFEQSVRARAEAVRRQLSATAAPDDPVSRRSAGARWTTCRLTGDRLRRDLERLRQRLAATPAALPPESRAAQVRHTAARLLTALRGLPPDSVPRTLAPAERKRLLQLIGVLRQALVAAGRREAPPDLPPEIGRVHAVDALERLYLACRADCRERIRGFPADLQRQKLGLWKDLQKAHVRWLYGS